MGNQPDHLDWIHKREIGLAAWLRKYLTKKGRKLPKASTGNDDLAQLKECIRQWSEEGEEADTVWRQLHQMKGAWTQQQIRNQLKASNLKACSFIISKSAQKNLQRLANKNQHSTPAACLEWLLLDNSAQRKAADKQIKEFQARNDEELKGKQGQIDALGKLLGYVVGELTVHTLWINEANKAGILPSTPQVSDVEKTYKEVRRKAIAYSGLTQLTPKHLAGLIKRPSTEEIIANATNILRAKGYVPAASAVERSAPVDPGTPITEDQINTVRTTAPVESPSNETVQLFRDMQSTSDAAPSGSTEQPLDTPANSASPEDQQTKPSITLPKRQKLSEDKLKSITKSVSPFPEYEGLIPLDPE